jgi:L-threonylcarbamoyladenylate synthase
MTPTEHFLLEDLLKEHAGSLPSGRLRVIADCIGRGAVFVYPTETIYGIGGSSAVPGVKERIFRAKRRAPDNDLILIAPDRAFFSRIPLIVPPAAEALAAAFWPGRLTLVLPLRHEAASVAIRVARHPFIDAIFPFLEAPLYSTSANISGEAYTNDPARISAIFAGKIDFFIDAGSLPASPPSTVVKIGRDGTAELLREGAIPADRIEEIAGTAITGFGSG